MKSTLTFLALSCTLWAAAQYNGNRETRYHGMLHIVEYQLPINGSQYVDEMYKKGIITIENPSGTIEEERLMRFNAFTGNMEYLNPDTNKAQTLLKRENVRVALDGRIYEVHSYREGDQVYRAFFIRMNPEGKVILYKQPLKHFRKGKSPEHGYEVTQNPEYFDASTYYLRMDQANMVPVTLNKRGLLKSLEDYRADLKVYVAEQDLNLRKEQDAVLLIHFYNSIQALN